MTKLHQMKQAGGHSQIAAGPLRQSAVLLAALLVVLGALLLAHQLIRRADGAEPSTTPAASAGQQNDDKAAKPAPYQWKSMFDGKTLKGWKVTKFGGEGEVSVKNAMILMEMGETLTGITWAGKPPRIDYELSLEGMRVDGNDFFCTTTFPIGDKYCSLVVGGWGGPVVGLSCVDFYDASDNITTTFHDFKSKRWYKVRIRVTKHKVDAWIDKEHVVDLPTKERKFDIRDEVDLSKPLGISAWCTSGAVRNIRIRKLKPEEAAPPKPKAEN